MSEFTHIDKTGNAKMVDVSGKPVTQRTAVARSIIQLPEEVLEKFTGGDFQSAKGSVVQASVIAGIMGAKKTSELIPLCHLLPLNNCSVEIELHANELHILCTVSTEAKTGVEMEALVGASVSALTVYDMCKALSHDMIIRETMLISKSGGKNDFSRK
jgi:cyclic pyranopterin phosphate synthase